ncbi:MAG: penicillin acylase family protein, partial [Alphaproteobacteria bacterium]
ELLRSGRKETLALRWLGHQPSDEFTAMLRLGRARNWEEFRAAFENFAVPGQNMIYADREGHIGKMIAAKVPARQPGAPADLAIPARHASWDQFIGGADLPFVYNPAEGLIVSANEPPAEKPSTLGYFFSPRDRARRLTELLSAKGTVAIEDLAAVLADVYSPSSIALRDALLPVLRTQNKSARSAKIHRLVEEFAIWDGRYAPDSVGALAFELLLHYFIPHFLGRARGTAFAATWDARRLILRDVEAAPSEQVAAALTRAGGRAARTMSRYRNWGDIHRLWLVHSFGLAPIIGRRYRFADRPAGGGGETIFKTAHDAVAQRHPVLYGSVARYFFDLADLDRNYFVLLGGQDGWLCSSTFLDQVPLWETNRSVQVPLCRETMHMTFRHKTALIPESRIRNRETGAKATKPTLV